MRSPRQIAMDIVADYHEKGKPVHWSAKPYVDAMLQLHSWDDEYYSDSAATCAIYAFSNLSTWRGEKAREIKAEWKEILASSR